MWEEYCLTVVWLLTISCIGRSRQSVVCRLNLRPWALPRTSVNCRTNSTWGKKLDDRSSFYFYFRLEQSEKNIGDAIKSIDTHSAAVNTALEPTWVEYYLTVVWLLNCFIHRSKTRVSPQSQPQSATVDESNLSESDWLSKELRRWRPSPGSPTEILKFLSDWEDEFNKHSDWCINPLTRQELQGMLDKPYFWSAVLGHELWRGSTIGSQWLHTAALSHWPTIATVLQQEFKVYFKPNATGWQKEFRGGFKPLWQLSRRSQRLLTLSGQQSALQDHAIEDPHHTYSPSESQPDGKSCVCLLTFCKILFHHSLWI